MSIDTATAAPPTPPAGPAASPLRALAARLPSWRSAGIFPPFVVLVVVLTIDSPSFLTTANLLNILDQQSAILVMAAAGTLVLISGGIDFSVGATYALAGVVAGQYAQTHGALPAALLGLGTGLVVGLANGVISTVLRINSLIATLAMSFIIAGLASKVTNGNLIVLTNRPQFAKIAQTSVLGVRTSIWIAVVAVVLFGLVLSRTTLGRYLYAAGGNIEAARLAGIRVTWVRIAAFAASGTAAALGGIVDTSRVLSAQSASGDALAFTVLAGIVVGGTSIMGGEGAIWRTVVGVLFIALVGNGFDLLGVNPLYQQIALGVILLLAVAMDAWARTLRR